uniref:hypothetical protein n=1 Tax=Prevotella sp. TaxID=59823 RepID=UPI00402A141C
MILLVSGAVLVSSCMTAAGAGAYAGSSLGSVVGSAIGGIAGGPRGSDVGTLIGMAGGAIVGGAIGNSADKQAKAEQSERLGQRNERIQRQKRAAARNQQYDDDTYAHSYDDTYAHSYDDTYAHSYDGADDSQEIDPSQMVDTTNSGNDCIDFNADTTGYGSSSVSASTLERADAERLEIKNVSFTDANGDGILEADEEGKMMFEIYNHSNLPVFGIIPTVKEAEDNRHIQISPSILVEQIAPGSGIRYTASVKADRRIKDGEARLLVSAEHDGKPVSYVTVVKVNTMKRSKK